MDTIQLPSIYQIFLRNYTTEGTFSSALSRLASVRAMGFDWIYLTPIHPIGKVDRKGIEGCPYAIADYRSMDEKLGTLGDFRDFIAEAHTLGLKVMMDVVYNHTSPDSYIAKEHQKWLLQNSGGKPFSKCADWTDVVDLDHRAGPERDALWDELIGILDFWRDQGVDGFRCDVASLVPLEFWLAARKRINRLDPKTGFEERPTLWLAESVHHGFLLSLRDRGFETWGEPELHRAFDLSYDYDGWEQIEKVWAGGKPLEYYLEYLDIQRALYPVSARKIRFLENHDQMRAAARFGIGPRLEAWTAFYQFIPGCTLVYMGQEQGITHRPSLFDIDRVDWDGGSKIFEEFFKACFAAIQRIKKEAPHFSYHILGEGIVLLERKGEKASYGALCNLDDRSGTVTLPKSLDGRELLSGRKIHMEGKTELQKGVCLIRYD